MDDRVATIHGRVWIGPWRVLIAEGQGLVAPTHFRHSGLIDVGDIRMAQPRQHLRLILEALQRGPGGDARAHHLQRHFALRAALLGDVNRAHAAGGQDALDRIEADAPADEPLGIAFVDAGVIGDGLTPAVDRGALRRPQETRRRPCVAVEERLDLGPQGGFAGAGPIQKRKALGRG